MLRCVRAPSSPTAPGSSDVQAGGRRSTAIGHPTYFESAPSVDPRRDDWRTWHLLLHTPAVVIFVGFLLFLLLVGIGAAIFWLLKALTREMGRTD